LLNLEEPQGIVPARHVEMGHIDIDRRTVDENTGDQRDDAVFVNE